ncbi:uncharacterized protein [Diadema antillarum]|uniref:uncharacterized protein isoform X2 n=1 Tax=Diadema antillarum TaxID=105358 RepID=UPI003A85D661
MSVKCYEENSSVKLVNGRSPHDGFVVFETNTLYVCPEGFDDRAADSVCGSLGFPTVEEYLNQTLPGTVTINGFIQLRCGEANKFLEECSLTTIGCPSNQVVRLKCREPAFIGCYKGAGQTLQSLFSLNDEVHVHSEDECMSTCQRVSGGQDVAVVHRRSCVCLQLEEFENFITGGRYSHHWTCLSQTQLDSDQVFFTAFNLSVGFCNHPGNVSNGQWNSNTTNFGSVITLSCGEGYVINGNKTLQCVSLSGKSTYFPVWNDTVPSCRAIKNEIHENTLQDVTPSTSTRNSIDYSNSAADSYASQWPTTMKETTVVSPSDPGTNIALTYTLSTILCVVFILLLISVLVWCNHQQKKGTTQPDNQSNGTRISRQLPELSTNSSSQPASRTEHVDSLAFGSSNAGTVGRPLHEHVLHSFSELTAQENSCDIYQNAAEVGKGIVESTRVEQISLCAVPVENNVKTAAMNTSSCREYDGLQEISVDQTLDGYEDCVYEDLNLFKNDKKREITDITARAVCLFDDSCYNSLNFGQQSNCVGTRIHGRSSMYNEPFRGDNEYDHTHCVLQSNRVESHIYTPSLASGSPSDKNDNLPPSTIGSPPFVSSENELYYQLNPEEQYDNETSREAELSNSFESCEFSSLKPKTNSAAAVHPGLRKDGRLRKDKDTVKPDFLSPKPQTCDDLYATVNKTIGKSPAALQACNALYSKVDKTGDPVNFEQESEEELYMNVTTSEMNA